MEHLFENINVLEGADVPSDGKVIIIAYCSDCDSTCKSHCDGGCKGHCDGANTRNG